MRASSARSAVAILMILLAGAVIVPLVSPHDPDRQFDPAAGRYLSPGSVRFLVTAPDGNEILVESVGSYPGPHRTQRLGRAIEITLSDECLAGRRALRLRFILGTDRLGRDLLSRLLFAGRTSMLVALLATAVAGAAGTAAGAIAGFVGGSVDLLIMRLVDVLLSFPQLIVVILGASLLDAGPAAVALIIASTSWMPLARIVRAEVRSARELDFITAAVAVGCSPGRILWRHLLPRAAAPAALTSVMAFGEVMLLESALSFLGLGSDPQTPSWGRMIGEGMIAPTTAWWVVWLPGMALIGAVLTVNLAADAMLPRIHHR